MPQRRRPLLGANAPSYLRPLARSRLRPSEQQCRRGVVVRCSQQRLRPLPPSHRPLLAAASSRRRPLLLAAFASLAAEPPARCSLAPELPTACRRDSVVVRRDTVAVHRDVAVVVVRARSSVRRDDVEMPCEQQRRRCVSVSVPPDLGGKVDTIWLLLYPFYFPSVQLNYRKQSSFSLSIPFTRPIYRLLNYLCLNQVLDLSSLGVGRAAATPAMASEGTATAAPSSGASAGWKQRIIVPTVLAGIVGGGAGLISKHRKVLGAGPVAASYVVNLAVVAGCYCSAREVARDARASEPDDLVNSVVGGMASGALLGRFQGGQLGAARYAILFAAVGTALDFTAIQLRPYFESFKSAISTIKDGNPSWSLPEWSPIQVLDEEAVAAKRAREQQIYAQRTFGKLNKEES